MRPLRPPRAGAGARPRPALSARTCAAEQNHSASLLPCGSQHFRAATKPSPPLLPLPQSTATCFTAGYWRRQKRATAAPAFSIRSMSGTPNCSAVRRSVAAISAAVSISSQFSTRIAGDDASGRKVARNCEAHTQATPRRATQPRTKVASNSGTQRRVHSCVVRRHENDARQCKVALHQIRPHQILLRRRSSAPCSSPPRQSSDAQVVIAARFGAPSGRGCSLPEPGYEIERREAIARRNAEVRHEEWLRASLRSLPPRLSLGSARLGLKMCSPPLIQRRSRGRQRIPTPRRLRCL